MNFNHLHKKTNGNSYEHLGHLISKYILPRAKRRLGDHLILEFKKINGRPSMSLLPGTKRKPVMRLTLMQNGDLKAGRSQESHSLLVRSGDPITGFQDEVRAVIAKEALKSPKVRDALLRITAAGKETIIHTVLVEQAKRYTERHLTAAVTPAGKRAAPPQQAAQLWNRLVKTHFLDPRVMEAASNFRNSQYLDTASYNLVRQNLELIEQESKSKDFQNLFSYLLHMPRSQYPAKKLKSTNDLLELIAAYLEMPVEHSQHLPNACRANMSPYTAQNLRATCRILTEAGIPPDHPEAFRTTNIDEHHLLESGGSTTWTEWTEAVHRFAQDGNYTAFRETKNQMLAGRPRPRNYSAPPQETTKFQCALEDAQNHLANQAKAAVAGTAPQWTPVTVSHKGRTTVLKAVCGPNGTAALKVTKEPGGTVKFKSPQTPTWQSLFSAAMHVTEPLIEHFAHMLLANTLQEKQEAVLTIAAMQPSLAPLAKEARNIAKEIARESVSTDAPSDFDHLVAVVNKAIRTHIIDPKAYDLAKRIFKETYPARRDSQDPNLRTYNFTKKNLRVFTEMAESGQLNPLRYYAINMLDKRAHTPVFNHPGQVIQEVREVLKMTNSQWKAFCRLGLVNYLQRPGSDGAKGLVLACEALAGANVLRTNPIRVQEVIMRTRDHMNFHEATWPQGDPWRAWVNLVARFIEEEAQLKLYDEFVNISDALRFHVTEGLAWGPGDWQTLLARSERWHRQNFRYNARNRYGLPPEAEGVEWDSNLAQADIDGTLFTALTTPQALLNAGERLGNCLATFWTKCAKGEARIFTAQLDPTHEAAVELLNHDNHWLVGQVEAPRQGKPPQRLKTAARKLAAAYQAAHDRTATTPS